MHNIIMTGIYAGQQNLCTSVIQVSPLLNRLQIEESSKPSRLSQQLSKPVTNYKPVANHEYNVRRFPYLWLPTRNQQHVHKICNWAEEAVFNKHACLFHHLPQREYEKKKKEEGKRARADKQQVLEMLFSAFEKHQYYNIKDLVDITKQPVVSPNRRVLNHWGEIYF